MLLHENVLYVFFMSCTFQSLSAELETLHDATGVGSDSEEAPRYLDVSLLQLALQLQNSTAAPELSNTTAVPPQLHRSTAVPERLKAKAVLELRNATAVQPQLHSAAAVQEKVAHASSLQVRTRLPELKGIFTSVGFLLFFFVSACCWSLMIGYLMRKDDTEQSPAAPPATSLLMQTPSASASSFGGMWPLHASKQEAAPEDIREAPSVPPIAPSLILPHTDAKFMIALESLKVPLTAPINIMGHSGRKLLQASVSPIADGRQCLALAYVGCEDDPRTHVLSPIATVSETVAASSTTSGAQEEALNMAYQFSDPMMPRIQNDLELYGKPDDFYGHIELNVAGSSISILHYGESQNPVIYLNLLSTTDLHMTATSAAGIPLATAQRTTMRNSSSIDPAAGQQPARVDVWGMTIKKGADALLIVSCMLALILIKPPPPADTRRP
mmetsp:Transcript_70213/g.121600  ORF Transcript_70213/g.121600 Transcript_70213/m.121600 type:complete len:442 (+) Transcript_70213:109-1434(+)